MLSDHDRFSSCFQFQNGFFVKYTAKDGRDAVAVKTKHNNVHLFTFLRATTI